MLSNCFFVRILAVFLCFIVAPAMKVSAATPDRSPWMEEYKKNGLLKAHFVEMYAGRHGMSILPVIRPPIPGEKFQMKVDISGTFKKVDIFLLNEKGETFDKPFQMPQHARSDDILFTGKFPSQSFYIMATVHFANTSSPLKLLNPNKVIPRTDLASYNFKLKLDPDSQLMKQAMRGKSFSLQEKIKIMTGSICTGAKMLESQLNPEALILLKKSMGKMQDDEFDFSQPVPITLPTFSIQSSINWGTKSVECNLNVLHKRGTFDTREFISKDPQWSEEECKGFQMLIGAFETQSRSGNAYAFQTSSCHNTGKDHRLKLQIATSKNSDFKFPAAKTATPESPKPEQTPVSTGSIQLKKLCSIPGMLNSFYNTPIDLSLEQAGKAVVDTGGEYKAYLTQAPDCKIVGRYKTPGFLNNTISRNGFNLFDKNRIFSKNSPIGDFGLETPEGGVTPLTPPENGDRKAAEFPKISVDGSAVIWKTQNEKNHASYLIQDLQGKTLKEFPGRFLKIYMVDMTRKTMVGYNHKTGLGFYDLDGKPLGTYLKIPGISLFQSHRPPIKWFKGKNGKRNWVAWNRAHLGVPGEGKPRILWDTDFGKGQYELGSGEALEGVSVSGDGRFIAIAYISRGSSMTQKADIMIGLISTSNSQRVFTQKLAGGRRFGPLPHAVAFLGDRYLAYNPMTVKEGTLRPQPTVLFEIVEKK